MILCQFWFDGTMWSVLSKHSLRLRQSLTSHPFQGSPIISRPFRGGEPPLGGGGVLVESFALRVRFYGSTPQSGLRLASSAQGTPYGCPKGEPKSASLEKREGNQRSWWRGSHPITKKTFNLPPDSAAALPRPDRSPSCRRGDRRWQPRPWRAFCCPADTGSATPDQQRSPCCLY